MTPSADNTPLAWAEIESREAAIELAALEAKCRFEGYGGLVVFAGAVRPTEDGRPIRGLKYEHHGTLAQRELQRVVEEALELGGVRRVACVHRVGFVPVGEDSVVIVAGAEHRAPAFEACRFVIEQLKVRVPIWKRVVWAD